MLRIHPPKGISTPWLLAALVLCLAVLLALGASIHNGFVYDDAAAIVGNSRSHDPTDLSTIFSSPYWTNSAYRPVTTTAFALLWWAGGGSPAPFFLTNLVLTIVVGCLLYALLSRLGATHRAALIAALVFVVHPVHVEVVANGVGLAELLSTAFLMVGAILTLRTPWPPGTVLLLGVCGLLALLSKESGITALALIPLLWLAGPRTHSEVPAQLRREAILVLLLFLVAGLAVRTWVLGDLGGVAPIRALAEVGPIARAQTVLGVVPEWARLLIWPAALQADYGPPQLPIGGPFGWRHTLGVMILLGWAGAFTAAVWRRQRLIAVGLLWVPIALSPVSNLLFPTGILLAERTLYLPSVGLALVVAGLVDLMPQRQRLVTGVAAVLIVLGGLRSHSRVGVWRNQATFFQQIVIDGPQSYRSWYVAGSFAAQQDEVAHARSLFAEAWRLEKRDFRVAEEYGQMLRAERDYESAVAVFREGFRFAPNEEPLTSRLLESLMALERWNEAEALVQEVASLSEVDGDRLQRRLQVARASANLERPQPITPPDTAAGSARAPAGP